MKKTFYWIIFILVLGSCKNTTKTTDQLLPVETEKDVAILTSSDQEYSKADKIILAAIEAHGGALYDQADYSFIFRKKEYRFINNGDQYTYSVKQNKEIFDFITNGNFERYINEEPVELSQKKSDKYAEALNSVIYFATLPHKLRDAAVNKKFIESTAIKGMNYDVIKITFNQEGGGKDHDDEFHYWINQKTKKIDYLAYNYTVNGGGVRFRSAYNQRVVDGITFQDYINWKAPLGTPLKDLPSLYEQDKLKELSRIINENITNKKQ